MDSQDLSSELSKLLTIEAGTIIFGWLAFIVGFIIKDILTSFIFGLIFYIDPQFKEGDAVYIDGEKAIIQKIGIRRTIFRMSETGKWRYVGNTRIQYMKLEKEIE